MAIWFLVDRLHSKEKLLSLYETETKIIVRGKAGVEVEFGNSLFVGEQQDGLIMDWRLYKDQAPSDNTTVIESLDRLEKNYDGYRPGQVTGDRGFFSKRNERILNKRQIQNNLCPRNIIQLQQHLQKEDFVRHQLRRGQTEGRIGIMKNCFLGTPFRNKGYISRERGVAWRVLAHNLWLLARLPRADNEKIPLKQAAEFFKIYRKIYRYIWGNKGLLSFLPEKNCFRQNFKKLKIKNLFNNNFQKFCNC